MTDEERLGYRIRDLLISFDSPVFSITEDEFLEVKRARDKLIAACNIEQAYEFVISNYLDLEREFLGIITESSVRQANAYKEGFNMRLRLNRRIVNLLTTTRMYINLARQRLYCIGKPDRSLLKEFIKSTSLQYDENFEYRFLEALRNHVQHGGIPIHSSEISGEWVGLALERRAAFYVTKEEISNKRKFKAAVREDMPPRVDLMGACRKYVGCIGQIQMECRRRLVDEIRNSRETIEGVIEKYNDLACVERNYWTMESYSSLDEDKKAIESVFVSLQWDDLRVELEASCRDLSSLGETSIVSTC